MTKWKHDWSRNCVMNNYADGQFQVIQVYIGKTSQLWQTPGNAMYLKQNDYR